MRQRHDNRINSGMRGYDSKWQRVRKRKADIDPLCEACLKHGIPKLLDVVHHIISIEDAPSMRLVMDNLMSLCTQCHEEIHGRLSVVGCDVNGMPLSSAHRWNK